MTTWKLPLVQVIASFPRPPLNLKIEIFVMAHLLGDPIDTAQNLLRKLAKCQARAEVWKEHLERLNLPIEESNDTDQDDVARNRQIRRVVRCR